MKLAEAKKMFSLPTFRLRNGRLVDAKDGRVFRNFWDTDGVTRIEAPLFDNETSAQDWLDSNKFYAEVVR